MNNFDFIFEGENIEASVEVEKGSVKVRSGEKEFNFIKVADNLYSCLINGRKSSVAVIKNNGTYYIDFDSLQFEVKDPSEDGFAGGAGDHGGEKDKIFAPMPGKIVKVMVEVGQAVEPKQQMVIVEAMKMENVVMCKAKGKVKAVNFSAGDQVDTETPIIELELDEE